MSLPLPSRPTKQLIRDSWDGVQITIPLQDVPAFPENLEKSQALKWMGSAGTRRFKATAMLDIDVNDEAISLPALESILTRSKHVSSPDNFDRGTQPC